MKSTGTGAGVAAERVAAGERKERRTSIVTDGDPPSTAEDVPSRSSVKSNDSESMES